MTESPLQVSHRRLLDDRDLARDWQELETRAQPRVFLSWQWMGVWLRVFQPEARVLRVMAGDELVGLGIIVQAEEKRHGLIQSRCLRLHQTGDPVLDQIWIEYNGFLAAQGHEEAVDRACLAYICQEWKDWDEFVLGAIEQDRADRMAAFTGLQPHYRWEAPCYGVDLKALRAGGANYLDELSRNTRHQIRRSRRLYEQAGPLRLCRPDSVEEALAMFDAIGPVHLARWGDGPHQSGFANPDFVRFHRQLIAEQWADGGVDLVNIQAGDKVIAAFYNLLHGNVVYFYLGGVHVEADNRLKPGLLGHTLCIEDYKHHGFAYYDFMGGQERYKANLGQFHCQLVQIALQRSRLKLRLEGLARDARNRWLGEPDG